MQRTSALVALVLTCASGCKEQAPTPAPATTASVAPTPTPTPTPVASTTTATSPAPLPSERCKALDKGKLVAIGSRGGNAHGLVARGGKVFVFAHEGARATLLAIPRDGSKAHVLGSAMLTNPPTGLVVDERAAYFVAGKKLSSLSLEGGQKPRELAKDVAPAVAVLGDDVYAVRCGKPDVLVRIPRGGGEAKTIAEIPQKPLTKCEYKSIAVDAKSAFVGDWSSRRIFAIDLARGAVDELVEKQAFLGSIALTPESAQFQASTGLLRVARKGGPVTSITSYGATPFESVAWDERDFYVLHTEAYAARDTLVRIPRVGGKLEELEFWQVRDPTSSEGRVAVAVDDQCVYVAQNGAGFLEVLARKKP